MVLGFASNAYAGSGRSGGTIHALPLMVKSVRATFESLDQGIEDAARTLGASEPRVFFTVTLPLARRSIQAATALAFARALGDFGVTLMIAGNIPGKTQTASVQSMMPCGPDAIRMRWSLSSLFRRWLWRFSTQRIS